MNIDLFKLNNFNKVVVDEDVLIPTDYYNSSDIRDIKDVHVSGSIIINEEDLIETDILVTGKFILPCAVTLEDVSYDFSTNIEEIVGKFDDFYDKNKNILDILPFIWENIVSEVPIRVVKEGVVPQNLNGEGWQLVSSD